MNRNPQTFGYKTRNSNASSGSLFGWYYPDTKKVLLHFYFTSSTNVSSNTLFTIDEQYRPTSNKEGSGIIKQGTDASANIVFGNFRINSSGEITNNMTLTCYACFGVITYSL